MTALSDEPGATVDGDRGDIAGVPYDVAVRLVRALDRAPTTVASLVGPDLKTRWLGRSAEWVMNIEPGARRGQRSLDHVHPDDVPGLVHGLAQLHAVQRDGAADRVVIQPIRYRRLRRDGSWILMEAVVQNMLDDPEVDGMVFISRPVGGELDGVDHVVDLLVEDAPLPDVLTACAGLVPYYLGSGALVALTGGEPVLGVDGESPVAHLVTDDRWWRPAVASGEPRRPADFSGFPDDLAGKAQAAGFATAWALPVLSRAGEAMGCLMVWLRSQTPPHIGTEFGLRQALRLASLVIGEQRRAHSLRREAVTDPLTGVGNRSALRQRLAAATGPVTLALLDLDDFKPVNDRYGHDTGDEVLRVVAQRLSGSVREDDVVARFGGDEFAVVFAPGTSPDGVAASTDRMLDAIARPIVCDGGPTVVVGASVGVATGDPREVVRLADAELYDAKECRGLGSGERHRRGAGHDPR
ncbi:MAG TPA: sensor domain-containing diguanylate cyclase [Acidimicrobiales bacterium]|nr:sensor domain-containing diguanylate cyclase [Acidimicrobiales bacterium]